MLFTWFLKVIFLLWAVNFMPPLLAYYLDDRFNVTLDRGIRFFDGKPILGPHKTIRGFLAGIIGGGVIGWLVGIGFGAGLTAGFLSMVGDITSSFLKRRVDWASGENIPGLDQIFEGLLPLVYLVIRFSLPSWLLIPLLAVFCLGAYVGSWFYKNVLFSVPYEGYPRPVKARLRFKELTSCSPAFKPVRYLFHFEEAVWYHHVIRTAIKLAGIYEHGVRNALAVERRAINLYFRDLPTAFDGYRILFLSDLHLDCLDGLMERLGSILDAEKADLCLLGGDYRMATHGSIEEPIDHLRSLVGHIHVPDGINAVLGNHDCLEMIEPMRKMGIEVLLNDARSLVRNGQTIWIAGVDDPHYYRCPSLDAACHGLPGDAFIILLSHSPEIFTEAEARNIRLYLCGHTHAGQIQLPWIGPVFTHSRSPRHICNGLWQSGPMLGYTSTGAGVSGVPVRFLTRGEVVLLTLRRGDQALCSCDIQARR